MKQVFAVFIAFSTLTACRKNLVDTSAFQVTPYFNCHNQERWSQSSIFDSLIGTWQWQYVRCNESGFSSFEKSKALTIEFKKDSTLTMVEDGNTSKTRFTIVPEDRTDFAVKQDSIIAQLGGRIYFCGNKVVFNASYIDVCDNYFVRLK
jgi:hypothetical protein